MISNGESEKIEEEEEIGSQEKVEINELEEIFRKMLVETCDNSTQKLVMIDTIQRLGVAYHFHNEIEISIQNIFYTTISQLQSENIDGNLYVVSLRFRLLRQQGHYISSVSNLSNNSLKVEVTEALSQPIHMTVPRVGARKYISIYQNDDAHNHLLLKFAKLDFNALQKLHQRELSELTRWWKDLDFANKYPHARDRLIECYLWILGVWDISVIDSLPSYMRPAYQALINIYNEMEQLLAKEGKSYRVYYAKYEMKKLVRAYFTEAQWLYARYTPKFRATSIINRGMDDISGHEDEQQRGHVASNIECYMKKYGASKQEAYTKYHKEVVNGWKDINKELLFRPTEVPIFVLERVLNFARVMNTLYKEEDGYTNSKGKLKNIINLLLVEPVKI
ncbi:hypothetical protein H5410_032522 [Solanum commersonii]|uniref:Uncharacterized protein n=1 Tax=Solanum commersonii TaxID=4109 RepID=A0A9J5YN55_SOLCO|nr:hypothetical protein H5410_032522 [Solanum commersonii]